MREILFNLPWAAQMGIIFGSIIVSFIAVVAINDFAAWLWNRRRARLAIARRQVKP